MLLSQIRYPDRSLGVVLRDGSEAALVKNADSTYALASGRPVVAAFIANA